MVNALEKIIFNLKVITGRQLSEKQMINAWSPGNLSPGKIVGSINPENIQTIQKLNDGSYVSINRATHPRERWGNSPWEIGYRASRSEYDSLGRLKRKSTFVVGKGYCPESSFKRSFEPAGSWFGKVSG